MSMDVACVTFVCSVYFFLKLTYLKKGAGGGVSGKKKDRPVAWFTLSSLEGQFAVQERRATSPDSELKARHGRQIARPTRKPIAVCGVSSSCRTVFQGGRVTYANEPRYSNRGIVRATPAEQAPVVHDCPVLAWRYPLLNSTTGVLRVFLAPAHET